VVRETESGRPSREREGLRRRVRCAGRELLTYVVADSVSPYDAPLPAVRNSPAAVSRSVRSNHGRADVQRSRDTGGGRARSPSLRCSTTFSAPSSSVSQPSGSRTFGITTLPVAGIPQGRRGTSLVAPAWYHCRGSCACEHALVAGGLLAAGIDPSFWVVLFSASRGSGWYVVGSTVVTESDGRAGVLGPFVLVGGALAGAALERQLAIEGLESYLTPTLLLNSWDGLTASNAGVYPQIVGSVVVVGFMAVLAFPVGIGAAIYLEEYAPNSGWGGRLATLLEVNISNLAGVPSVVYGPLGLALFRNALGSAPASSSPPRGPRAPSSSPSWSSRHRRRSARFPTRSGRRRTAWGQSLADAPERGPS